MVVKVWFSVFDMRKKKELCSYEININKEELECIESEKDIILAASSSIKHEVCDYAENPMIEFTQKYQVCFAFKKINMFKITEFQVAW